MITTTFQVEGMTCENCVKHVTEELNQIEGVASVDVNLETGLTTLTSAGEIPSSSIEEAIDEAGYSLIK